MSLFYIVVTHDGQTDATEEPYEFSDADRATDEAARTILDVARDCVHQDKCDAVVTVKDARHEPVSRMDLTMCRSWISSRN